MAVIGKYRWGILALLFFATTINYLDRQIIGLLKPLLEKEFNWSESDYARIVMAFTAAYAIGLLVLGKFIDAVGTRIGYAIAIVFWSVAGMFHAAARSVGGFVWARIALGLGEAGNFPAAVKAVAEWFPKNERGIATGIFNAGTSIGVVIALLIVPFILQHYHWQAVFLITGAVGFVWLIAWMAMYRLPAQHRKLSAQELAYIQAGQDDLSLTGSREKIKWWSLFRMPQTWAYITGKGLIDPIYWFFLFWLPSYFASSFNLDLKKPSVELMIIYAATTVGSIAGGYLSSMLIKAGWPTVKARKAALLIFAVLELSIITVQFASNIWIVVALISIAVAVHQAWAANVFTLASDMFPREAVSSVVGIGGMAGAANGILFPWLVGHLLDYYKSLGDIQHGYNILFTICGCTFLIALLIIHLLTRKIYRGK
jgi:ACS family hexuronate transporter-like MFS transporter